MKVEITTLLRAKGEAVLFSKEDGFMRAKIGDLFIVVDIENNDIIPLYSFSHGKPVSIARQAIPWMFEVLT